MALASIYRVTQDLAGNVVTEVLGTVTLAGTSTLASLFSDEAGTAPLPNPLVNNPTYGSFQVFVGAGLYDFSFIKAGYTFETQRNISARDPAAGVNTLTGTANQVLVTPASGVGAVTLSTPQNLNPDANIQFFRMGLGQPVNTGFSLITSGAVSFGGNATVTGTLTATNVTGNAIVGVNTAQTAALTADTGQIGLLGIGRPHDPAFSLVTQGQIQVGSNLTAVGTVTANALVVNTTATVTGIATCAGTLRVGTPAPASSNYQEAITYNKNTGYGLVILPTTNDTGGGNAVLLYNIASTVVGSINTTATATSFNTSSDARLKTDVQPLLGALDVLRALRPVAFRWREGGSLGHGFLAQEVLPVVPEAVSGTPDAVDEAGQLMPMGMDPSKLVVWLVGSLQEALAQVDGLTARVQALESA